MLVKWLLLWLWRAQLVTYIPSVCQSRFRWFRTTLYCLFGQFWHWHHFWIIQIPNITSIVTSFWCFVQFFVHASWRILLGSNACEGGGLKQIFVVKKFSFVFVEDVWVVWVLLGYFSKSNTLFDLCVVRWGSAESKHHKDTRLKEIGLCILLRNTSDNHD